MRRWRERVKGQAGRESGTLRSASEIAHVTFLGVDIDTNDCVLSLGADKLNMLHDKLKAFKHRQRATKVQLQSLAGSLNWACQVVRGGRFFLRRILDSIKPLRQAALKRRKSKKNNMLALKIPNFRHSYL